MAADLRLDQTAKLLELPPTARLRAPCVTTAAAVLFCILTAADLVPIIILITRLFWRYSTLAEVPSWFTLAIFSAGVTIANYRLVNRLFAPPTPPTPHHPFQ